MSDKRFTVVFKGEVPRIGPATAEYPGCEVIACQFSDAIKELYDKQETIDTLEACIVNARENRRELQAKYTTLLERVREHNEAIKLTGGLHVHIDDLESSDG